jgi:hypothetical protein
MRNLIKYLAVLPLLLFLLGCNNDDALYTVTLNESFIAKKGCEYTCVTDDGDVIRVKVTDIDDNRAYGSMCSRLSFGTTGEADIITKIKVNDKKYSKTYSWPGCDGIGEYPPDMVTLPKIEIEDYTITMMKLYPLSEFDETSPSSEKDYGVRLIILK